jgi:hypothetical protein
MSLSQKLYNVIASGSDGNCEIVDNTVMIDCGVPYYKIKSFSKTIKLVIITHEHHDHMKMNTIRKLSYERPTVRFAIAEYLLPHFEGIRNVDVLELNKWHYYGNISVSIGKLYHDVPNIFIRLDIGGVKIFRATDTFTLQGITAKNYNIYAIESNYNEETVWETIQRIEEAGGYAHQRGSINSHLSEQQCNEFYYSNKGEQSQLIRLHQTKTI